MKKQLNGFIVLQILIGGGSHQPVFSDDDGLCFYKFKWMAKLAINDCINDVDNAIRMKYMDEESRMTKDDYKVIPATIINPYAKPANQIIVCFFDGDEYRMKRSEDDWKRIGHIDAITYA